MLPLRFQTHLAVSPEEMWGNTSSVRKKHLRRYLQAFSTRLFAHFPGKSLKAGWHVCDYAPVVSGNTLRKIEILTTFPALAKLASV
jgi:hypothetical protein